MLEEILLHGILNLSNPCKEDGTDGTNHAAFVLPADMFTISADGTPVEEVGAAVKLTQSSAGTTIDEIHERAHKAS